MISAGSQGVSRRRDSTSKKKGKDASEAFGASRYRPSSLEQLCKCTKFSRSELQTIYRGFKQQCPTGVVDCDRFCEIFKLFFPQGDPTQYAQKIFEAFDQDKSGIVTFEELVRSLSILSRGTPEEKLVWVFNMYDLKKDGVISHDELTQVITSVYGLLGTWTTPRVTGATCREHADRIFKEMDRNCNGVVTREEFILYCSSGTSVISSISSLDTVF